MSGLKTRSYSDSSEVSLGSSVSMSHRVFPEHTHKDSPSLKQYASWGSGLRIRSGQESALNSLSPRSSVSRSSSCTSGNMRNSIPQDMEYARVAIRCRPSRDRTSILTLQHGVIEAVTDRHGGRRRFRYDHVFAPETTQEELFTELIQPMLEKLVYEGTDTSILAYGQTGTGKTYTMLGKHDFEYGKEAPEEDEIKRSLYEEYIHVGIVPRTFDYLFGVLESEADSDFYQMKLSCLQIYLDSIYDLLPVTERILPFHVPEKRKSTHQRSRASSTPKSGFRSGPNTASSVSKGFSFQPLMLREHNEDGVHVEGLNWYQVPNFEAAQLLLSSALRNRTFAATHRNMFSSRSHTIITICLTKDNEKDRKCYLVDLAGSERLSPANKETKQRKEAKSINQSLSALGNVISALASQSKQEKNSRLQKGLSPCPSTSSSRNPTHVRYRESKLTRLLEKSISGKRGRLVLIGTIDPNAKNLSETISTLKFASRCKSVPTNTSRYDQSSNTRLSQSPLCSPLNIQSMSVESLQRVCLQLQDELSLQKQREKELHLAYQEQIHALEQQIEYFKWNEHVQPPRVPSSALEKIELSRSKSDNGYSTKARNITVETHKEDHSDESDDELLELGDQLDSLIEEQKKHTSSKKSASRNITADKSVPTRVISLQEGSGAYEKQLLMAKTPLEMMRQSSRILEGFSSHRTEGRETDEGTLVSETDSTEYALYASSEDTERDSIVLDCSAPLTAVVSESEVSSAAPLPSSTAKVDPAALYEALHHIAQRLHVTRRESNPPESCVSTKELDSEEGHSVTTEMITALTQEIVCTMSTVAKPDKAQDENLNGNA